ncbi:MAG: S9 family peptidase [Bacteroidetes bacterium]|nr:S9 family peptidase [Bacteroidota bacterium]
MRKSFLIIWAIALAATFSTANAQEKKDIQLQDIWASGKFYPEMLRGVNPMADGETYLVDEDTALNVFNYKTGKFVKTLVNQNALMVQGKNKPLSFGNFSLSKDETKLLIPTETESIYRHSTKSNYFVYDLKTKAIIALSENGKQSLADFSPDGVKIAFVRDNNLFIKDLTNFTETQLTFDGKHTEIINGTTDWVYEEEFGFTKAFFWSPDSKKIAFYRFDESRVKEFQLEYFQGLYPEWYTYKYPKAGEDNSLIAIKVYDLHQKSTDDIPLGTETDIYIPRIKWTNSPNLLAIQRMNRLQNRLEILLADISLKKTSLVYEENNTYYIDITDNLNFLNDNKHFIITSEKDGFNHIYLYDLSGKQLSQLTKGNWDVTEVYGVDSKGKTVYFQSAETGPLDRQVYSVDMKGIKKALTNIPGTNDASFSSSYAYFINTNTTANTPHLIQAFTGSGKFLRTIIDNTDYQTMLSGFNLSQQEFFTISDPAIILPSGEAVSLNAWRIVPPDFDPAKKYPVLIYVYGGPGSQTVTNAWGWHNYFWFQMLAEKGIVVISVDNRGTGARGETFKKMTYKELGKYETEDMITTAKYLGGLDYVDKERIGIFGWSYGGYMSSLAITKGAEVFSSAIAVAPVTNWRNYDNIYTERFMQTPQINASGYDDNSPVNHVKELKGSFLLVHGSADDNVHYQNTMELINALVKANKQFELMIYPNRNHGIYGGTTRLHLYTLMNDFLDRNLLKQGE